MFRIKNDIQLSKNFQLHEVVCKCGKCESIIDLAAINKLQELRDFFGKPIYIHSAYRCPEYNKLCGGVDKSFHMDGIAFDITVKDVPPLKVAKTAKDLGFNGVGLYPTFTHVDIRNYKSYWKQIDGKNVSVSNF